MDFVKKIFKVAVILVVVCVAAFGGFFLYEKQSRENRLAKELIYSTSSAWRWHDKDMRIQIRKNEDGRSILRRVHMKDAYVVYAMKDTNYNLSTVATFLTSCEPGTVIETPSRFESGDHKALRCSEDGSLLVYAVDWNTPNTSFNWKEYLGGFSINENLFRWDFSVLDKEVSLARSKSK